MTRNRLKRTLILVGVLWFVLGAVAYDFYPAVLTGSRLIDAILVSAILSVLAAELLEVVGGVLYLLFRKPSANRRCNPSR